MTDEVRLIDIVEEFVSGDWGEENATAETPCAVSCVRGADIVPISNSRFENIPVRYISAASFKSRRLSEGDIIIEKSGGSPTQSTGRTVYVSKKLVETKKNIVCSNFCQAFRIKDGWNPLYVYYYLQVVYNSGVFFNFEGKTSGLKNLILDSAFQSITIKKVPLEEQDRVANLLSLIDDKIAANHAINDYLEAMARQLYDYWFVQYDFPDEDGSPYKSSGGKMVWCERLKRYFPDGWNVLPLKDISEIVNGATPSTEESDNYGGEIVWITPKDLSNQKSKFTFFGERNITQKGYDSCSTTLVKENTILLSSRAPIGLLSIAKCKLCTNQGFKSISPMDTNTTPYLYYFIKEHLPQIEQLGSGTTFKEVSRGDIEGFPIMYPPKCILDKWTTLAKGIFEKQFALYQEVVDSTKMRDELIPLLMNGQVSVRPLNNHLSELYDIRT